MTETLDIDTRCSKFMYESRSVPVNGGAEAWEALDRWSRRQVARQLAEQRIRESAGFPMREAGLSGMSLSSVLTMAEAGVTDTAPSAEQALRECAVPLTRPEAGAGARPSVRRADQETVAALREAGVPLVGDAGFPTHRPASGEVPEWMREAERATPCPGCDSVGLAGDGTPCDRCDGRGFLPKDRGADADPDAGVDDDLDGTDDQAMTESMRRSGLLREARDAGGRWSQGLPSVGDRVSTTDGPGTVRGVRAGSPGETSAGRVLVEHDGGGASWHDVGELGAAGAGA